jgi:O-acetylserine/cysteine efflux transporter
MTLKFVLLTLLVIVIWSSNFIAIKVGVESIAPLVLLTMRFTLAGLLFIPFIKWPGWQQARMIILVGILMGPLHQALLYVGLTHLPAGLTSILMQSSVIITTIIGWLFLKESVGWRTWLGVLIGVMGVAILIGLPEEAQSETGIIIILISAFMVALAYVAQKKVGHVHPPTYIALMFLPSAPLIALSSLLIEGTGWANNIAAFDWVTIATVVVYQAVILSLSHMVWQHLVVKLPMSQLVPWTLLIPVFAVAFAVLLLGESLTINIVLGGFITIVGVGIVTVRRVKKKQIEPIELNTQ